MDLRAAPSVDHKPGSLDALLEAAWEAGALWAAAHLANGQVREPTRPDFYTWRRSLTAG